MRWAIKFKPLQDNLPDRPAGFQFPVRCLQVVGIDGAQVFTDGGLNIAMVNQIRYAVQQATLLVHISSLEHGTCKHKLYM